MTVSPVSRPLLPVLGRMALGLLIVSGGALLTWRGVSVTLTPGMSTTTTALEFPLDGPDALDLAEAANLRLEGNLLDITVGQLPAGNPMIVQGEVKHRVRNPVELQAQRQGRQVNAALKINVQSLSGRGVMVTEPEPVQHTATLNLTRHIPLTLSSRTTSGNQTLTLTVLRLRALNVRTTSGDQDITLPGRMAGPFSLVSHSGNVNVTAPSGAQPEALRVNVVSGDLNLDLGGASIQTLGVGTDSGDVRLTLPQSHQRGTVTTSSGDVTVSARPGTAGNLDIRTQSGQVTLRAPRDLKLRVRFTDRDTITLPADLPPATAPQLDVFVDAPGGDFVLEDSRGIPLPLPEPDAAPQDTASRSSSRP